MKERKTLRCALFSVREGKTRDKIIREGNKDWGVSIPGVKCGSVCQDIWGEAVLWVMSCLCERLRLRNLGSIVALLVHGI